MGVDYKYNLFIVNIQHFILSRGLGLYTTSMRVHMEVKNNLVMGEWVGYLRYLRYSMQSHLPLKKAKVVLTYDMPNPKLL